MNKRTGSSVRTTILVYVDEVSELEHSGEPTTRCGISEFEVHDTLRFLKQIITNFRVSIVEQILQLILLHN